MATPNATITKNIALAPDGWKRSAFPDGSTPNAGPSAPPEFTTSADSSSITATITSANGATSYQVRVDGGTAQDGLIKTGLSAETTYSFQVKGINEYGESNWSSPVSVTTASTSVVILEQSDFSNGAPSNWFLSTSPEGTLSFSNGYARGEYPSTVGNGESHVNISIPIPEGVFDLYIQFRARMPLNKGGCKFLKVHGREPTSGNYANTTFGTDYSTGDHKEVSFGNGGQVGNDVGTTFQYTGNINGTVRHDGNFNLSTPKGRFWDETDWGTDWHTFKIRCKFNSGTTAENEVADGEYYVEIDDEVWLHATGFYNRHYSNESIEKVTLFNWSQDAPDPFTVDYDDVIISTGGFV